MGSSLERAREEAESIIRSLFAIVKVKDAMNLLGDGNSGGDKKDRYWKYFGGKK